MNTFEIVAHRGVATEHPENTIPAFQRAIEHGADAIELDVRLTKDKIPYEALHKAKLAQARAVHLHPSQLSAEVVETVRSSGVEIHAWDVNDEPALQAIVEYNIPKVCTDHFEFAAGFRNLIRV